MELMLPSLLGTQTDLGRGRRAFKEGPSRTVLKTQKGVDKSTPKLNRWEEVEPSN